MALLPGTHLGPYEIQSSLGARGRGEVNRAHDTKLGLAIALKVLPEAFAADPGRMARFLRYAWPRLATKTPHPQAPLPFVLPNTQNHAVHIHRLRNSLIHAN